MTIEWLSEAAAETEFDDTLTQWATMYGYKGCYSAAETAKAVADSRAWALRSHTARRLMLYIHLAPQTISVVGMRGGYQCFDSTAGRNKDRPVIFIDLNGKLTVNVRTPHNLHLDPNACTGLVEELDNNVALLHEFGHAKQWIERPTLFDNRHPGRGGFDARIEKKTFATDIREKAMEMRQRRTKVEDNLEKAGKLPYKKPDVFQSKAEFDEFRAPAWGPVIEMDNMARHEWPICREMGLPLRANYRDINCTSDSSPSLTSLIRRKVEEELARERAKAEAKAQEARRIAQANAAGAVCAVCGERCKNAMMLKHHMFKHTA
jgi:hypothetical protein